MLELPTGWRNGARVLGRSDVLIMMQQWYQSAHAKRRLGGNTSRNPAYKFQYFSETPLSAQWIALMNADRSHLAPYVEQEFAGWVDYPRSHAPGYFDLLGIRYVLLYEAQATPALLDYVEQALPLTLVETWQGEDWSGLPNTIRLFAVDGQPATATVFDMATPDSQMLLAEGWSPQGDPTQGRFALRPQVDLILPALTEGGQVTLNFAQPATVTYQLDGAALAGMTGLTHTLTIPPAAQRAPAARLTLEFSGEPRTLANHVTTPSPVGATGASLAPGVALMARSAGEEVGNFAEIWLNGIDVAVGSRGYNLAAISPEGDLLDVGVFDTFTAGESGRMADWLDKMPTGTIIVGAVADEASLALDQTGIDALVRLGVVGDLRGQFRASHAFIGVVGAAPATALETTSLIYPATVWLGAPIPASTSYGALRSLTIAPASDAVPPADN